MADNPNRPDRPGPKIDASVPHTARIWNYWLGGKDHYQVDREVGEQTLKLYPEIGSVARQARALLGRVIRYLADEEGVRQFLDIGTGLPTVDNTHEIAQRVAPESKIVYVDNDPLVLAHARALLTSSPEGACEYVDADLRDPETIRREAGRTLDFSRPVAVTMFGILIFVGDDDEARSIVRTIVDALAPGSYLALTHATNVVHGARTDEAVRIWNEAPGAAPMVTRTPEQIARFFDGLELLEPGIVPDGRWRPEPNPWGYEDVDDFCGVGRKPAR